MRGFIRRHWVLMIVAPVLAAGLAGGWRSTQPVEYRASGTVVLHVPDPGASAAFQWVANFRSALTSRTVAETVAAEVGVPPGKVRDGLSSEQIGTSTIVEVSYTGNRRAAVQDVVRAASAAAVRLISDAQIAAAEETLANAREHYDTVVAERREFLDQTGGISAQELYRARLVDLAAARSAGNAARVRELQEIVDRLADLASETQRIEDRFLQATSMLNGAERGLLETEAPAEAAAKEPVKLRGVFKQGTVRPTVRTAISALAAALAVGLGLSLLRDARAGRLKVPSLSALRGEAAPEPVSERMSEPVPAASSEAPLRRYEASATTEPTTLDLRTERYEPPRWDPTRTV